MKKIVLSVTAVMLAIAASAVTYMSVKTVDGQEVIYDLDNVKKIDYEEDAKTSTRYMCTENIEWHVDKYDVENVEVVDYEEYVASGEVDGYEYVDLGLPSGLLWSTMNVGMTKFGQYEFGDFFAFGEVSTKDNYLVDTYAHAERSIDELLKNGVLKPQYDAATWNWSQRWRTPKMEEFQELMDNCVFTWIAWNGIYGYKVVSLNNGNWIFLPAAGHYSGNYLYLGGTYEVKSDDEGCYLTSNVKYESDWKWLTVNSFYIGSGWKKIGSSMGYDGLSVRPVTQK